MWYCRNRCRGRWIEHSTGRDDSDSLRHYIPVAVTGPHIRVRAFARFEDTVGVFDKASALTTIVAAQGECGCIVKCT
jgi:hypothetical protein